MIEFEAEETVLHREFAWLVELLEWAAAAIDIIAIAILLIGTLRFLTGYVGAEFRRDENTRAQRLNRERIELGRYILAGLEVFIVSDVIHTALSLRISDLLFLGLLVVIRSLTSFFLDREIAQLEKEVSA